MKLRTLRRRPILEQVPLKPRSSFLVEEIRAFSYGVPWHFHPEHQIMLVLKSRGYRIVGDSMEKLKPGDLVLVGSNLPHVWHQEESTKPLKDGEFAVHAVVVRFAEDFLGEEFFQKPELELVRQLLRRAGRGLKVLGRTRAEITQRLLQLPKLEGLSRLVELLTVLNVMAKSEELQPLSSANFDGSLMSGGNSRMDRVLQHIHQNLSRDIDRSEVARKANLSDGAFSRFFKARTGRTLPQYVNELRIGRACLLLAETDRKVGDVAEECGFESLANFNRHFLKMTQKTPREWRKIFQHSSGF